MSVADNLHDEAILYGIDESSFKYVFEVRVRAYTPPKP